MAEYKVVEVTQLNAGTIHDGCDSERFTSSLSEFCPMGWEIVSARLMSDIYGAQRALVLLSR